MTTSLARARTIFASVVLLAAGSISFAGAAGATTPGAAYAGRVCPPSAAAVSYSDALDKLVVGGRTIGGLSDLAYDRRSRSYLSTVDNRASDPATIWSVGSPYAPKIRTAPLILTRPDGTPYTGVDSDNEGLAVLPDGDFLVSSETEPSVRIYGRNGVQKSALPVPPRFAVAPAGEATANATLEGLTISPDGRRIVAAMEGTRSGDTGGDLRRFLVYDRDKAGGYTLTKQIAYRVDPGQRVAEVAAYGKDRLVVMEASFAPATGNAIRLYAVTGLATAPDVSGVADLAAAPTQVRPKTLVADVTACPALGATAKQPQTNPLMDNYEGMAVTAVGRLASVSLISDDNFGATQITRVLNLVAVLP